MTGDLDLDGRSVLVVGAAVWIPGIAYENGLVQRFLPEITLAEVNAPGARLDARSQPRRRRVSAPKKAGVAVPNEATLAAVIKAPAAAR